MPIRKIARPIVRPIVRRIVMPYPGELGRELILNPSFDSGASWVLGTGWTIAAGNADHAAGTASDLQQLAVPLIADRQYTVVVVVASISGANIFPQFTGGSITSGAAIGTPGTHTSRLTAQPGNNSFVLSSQAAAVCSISSVSVKEILA
jgi:hypothetical protein